MIETLGILALVGCVVLQGVINALHENLTRTSK